MQPLRKSNLAKEIIETLTSVNMIDLLYKSKKEQPALYRFNSSILASLIGLTFILAILISIKIKPFIYNCNVIVLIDKNWKLLLCTSGIFIILFALTLFILSILESLPIKKKMKEQKIPTPWNLINFRHSKELSQMLLEKKYRTCQKNNLLRSAKENSMLIDHYITTIKEVILTRYDFLRYEVFTKSTIIALALTVVGAILSSVWGSGISSMKDIKTATGITIAVITVAISAFFIVEAFILFPKLFFFKRLNKSRQACEDLRQIQLYINNGYFRDDTRPALKKGKKQRASSQTTKPKKEE